VEPTALSILSGAITGFILALTGAGGGVLAIPLLVFVLHLPVQQAAPVGLLAVGVSAFLGAALGLRQGIVRYRAALVIGCAGMLIAPLGVFMAQRLPNRPLLAAFGLLLAYVAWRTLRHPAIESQASGSRPCRVNGRNKRLSWTLPCARALALTGLVSGLLSGLLGVGGGFVIVPALTRHTDLDIRSIQATSLAVIALVSVSAISTSALHGSIPWTTALPFTAGAVLALLAGRRLANRLEPDVLQHAFAGFSACVALLMLARAGGWMMP
jgi:uncharacterized membrane protein YfcA